MAAYDGMKGIGLVGFGRCLEQVKVWVYCFAAMLQRLYSKNLFLRVKMGLRNMHALREYFGYPDRSFGVVHVAGTNGKGSVATKCATALEHAGYRTGLFTSPHLASYRERFRVNRELATESDIVDVLGTVFEGCEALGIPATFFELTTLASLLHFSAKECDMVVLETGLGGRLDATNVVYPLATVITSIGRDHMGILGHTLDDIAAEKAGILKPFAPAVLGASAARPPVIARANAIAAPIHLSPPSTSSVGFDETNSALAATAAGLAIKRAEMMRQSSKKRWVGQVGRIGAPLRRSDREERDCVDVEELVTVARSVRAPCRLEAFEIGAGNLVVLDTAHNADALRAMWTALQAVGVNVEDVQVVLACSSDRPPLEIAQVFHDANVPLENITFTEADTTRAMQPQLLHEAFLQLYNPSAPLPENVFPRTDGNSAELKGKQQQEKEEKCGIPSAKRTLASDGAEPSSHKVEKVDEETGVALRYAQRRSGESAVSAAVLHALSKLPSPPTTPTPTTLPPPSKPTSITLICGTVFMMAEARRALHIPQVADRVVK